MTSSLTCALRTALEAKRKLVVPDTLCCHPLHCGRKRCEPTLNFFSLNGGNVLLESQVSTRGPVVLPCTQNLSSWNQTSVLQRPRDCKRYWFQACENGTSKVRNQTWQPWTPPGNNSQWIQASVTRLKREAAAANATVTCLHVRRTDKMGRDYPCSVRDLTPLNIRRTLRTYYPELQWLFVITDEKKMEYIHNLHAVLSVNYTVVSRTHFSQLNHLVGPHADVLADYGICNKFPTIESRKGRQQNGALPHYLTTDLKNGCIKDTQRRCPNYQCTAPGQWSRP